MGWRVACTVSFVVAAVAYLLTPSASASTARTFRFRSTPIHVSAYETNTSVARSIRTPRRDGFVTHMRVRVVDRRGRRVPSHIVMLHHVLFLNHGRFRGDRWGTDCTKRPREPFFGTGEEEQSLQLPPGYGYRTREHDRWAMAWMVMNHAFRDRVVRLEYRVTLDTARRLVPVTPYWITTSCNKDRVYSVAGGGASGAQDRHERLWTVPQDGRIVAAAAHAHGGARRVTLSQPHCYDRLLLSSNARYGLADDPIYHVAPVLHEPSPRSLSWALSSSGWHVRRGERLRVSSIYDAERPHVKVMGIMHLYVARNNVPARACAPQPGDAEQRVERFLGYPGRPDPPPVSVQLSARTRTGPARPIARPPGKLEEFSGDATFTVREFRFRPANVSVPQGAVVRWRFRDRALHDVTVADGPLGFASLYSARGDRFATRLVVPGDYRIFCSLHPVVMAQAIHVRGPRE